MSWKASNNYLKVRIVEEEEYDLGQGKKIILLNDTGVASKRANSLIGEVLSVGEDAKGYENVKRVLFPSHQGVENEEVGITGKLRYIPESQIIAVETE